MSVKQRKLHEEASRYQFETKQILLGPWASYSLLTDPKHLVFVLSRYKFAAKLLKQGGRTLEIGCGDALGAPILAQVSGSYVGIDFEERLIPDNRLRLSALENMSFEHQDITLPHNLTGFDTLVMIDVLEHIEPPLEFDFLQACCKALQSCGVAIIGMPSKASEPFASPQSASQHINLKHGDELKATLSQHFEHVWIFSMNDEVVHTGFQKLAHYLFALCANPLELIPPEPGKTSLSS